MPSEDSDQYAHSRSLFCSETSLGVFWIAKEAKFLSVDNKNGSDCAVAQAYWNLCLSNVPGGTFSDIAAHYIYNVIIKMCGTQNDTPTE